MKSSVFITQSKNITPHFDTLIPSRPDHFSCVANSTMCCAFGVRGVLSSITASCTPFRYGRSRGYVNGHHRPRNRLRGRTFSMRSDPPECDSLFDTVESVHQMGTRCRGSSGRPLRKSPLRAKSAARIAPVSECSCHGTSTSAFEFQTQKLFRERD